jgi:predicted dehydrogenase
MNVDYQPILPENPVPIIIIGSGGIARDAHLPAYRKADFNIFGIVDKVEGKAKELAKEYHIGYTYNSAKKAVAKAPPNAIYDLALPPEQSIKVLKQLPDNASVLIQKPMGSYFNEAQAMYSVCKHKNLTAAVNFQLRFAPFTLAARNIIESDSMGEIYDIEVRLTAHTPWELFPSVMHRERLEIPYHSIHYIDLIRAFLGDPEGIMAKTLKHPCKELSSTRSTILLDYGDTLHAVINTNHDHAFGPANQESFIKWEGTKGAIKAKMGVLLDYPEGAADKFEYCLLKEDSEPEWQTKKLEGS